MKYDQLVSTSTTINRQANEGVQLNSTSMLVKYGALGFTHEGGINLTQTCDVGDDSIFAFDYYWGGMWVEYFFKTWRFHGGTDSRASICIGQESEGHEVVLWERNSSILFGVGAYTQHNIV